MASLLYRCVPFIQFLAFFLGVLAAAVLLLVNYLLLGDVSLRLALTLPIFMKLYVSGIRIHHLLVGAMLVPLALGLYRANPPLGMFLLGFGTTLAIDDFQDIVYVFAGKLLTA